MCIDVLINAAVGIPTPSISGDTLGGFDIEQQKVLLYSCNQMPLDD